MKDITSFFQNGAARGDADEAPYTEVLFAQILNTIYSSEEGSGYVIPLYRDNLEVTAGAALTVNVDDGAAFIKGKMFLNTATENLALAPNNAEHPRWDRVVVRINYDPDVQTVRLAVVEGRPDCVPTLPKLTQIDNDIWEISLARVYIPSGAATVSSYYVHDERVFAETALHENLYAIHNQFRNGEHLAWSGYPTYPPDLWYETGTPVYEAHAAFPHMSRGCTLYMETTAGDILNRSVLSAQYGDSRWFTLRLLLEVLEGECRLDFAGVQVNIPQTYGAVEILIRVSTIGYQTLTFQGTQDPDIFKIGQITLTQGLIPAPYEPQHEIVLYNHVFNIPGVGGAVGAYEFTFSPPPGELFPASNDTDTPYERGLQAFLVKLKTTSAGSAGVANCQIRLLSNSQNALWILTSVGNLPNNSIREQIGWIQAEPYDSYPFDERYVINYEIQGAAQTAKLDLIGIHT